MADHSRILQWIESIVDSNPSCTEPCKKKAKHTHKTRATADFLYPYNTQALLVVEEPKHDGYQEPHTPPATGTGMPAQSTPRRQSKRQVVDDDHDDDAMNDGTPTQRTQSQHERSRKKAKENTKLPDFLLQLETPVQVEPWNLEGLSAHEGFCDIKRLYEHIKAYFKERGVVPYEVRELFAAVHKKEEGLAPFGETFRTDPMPLPVVDRDIYTTVELAKMELKILRNIQHEATFSTLNFRNECSWITHVYAPLLSHVFQQDVRMEHVSSATMEGDSIPLKTPGIEAARATSSVLDASSEFCVPVTASSVSYVGSTNVAGSMPEEDKDRNSTHIQSRSGAKIVDLVLVLDLPKHTTLRKAIFDVIMSVRGNGRRHVNQTACRPIQERIIAVSIEAKTESSGVDPLIQLGLWTAAWYKRMRFLRRELFAVQVAGMKGIIDERGLQQLREQERKKRLITVPVITVVGHQWDIYFAMFDESITMHGPVELGSTRTLMQIYALVASLRAIETWVQTTFKTAMEDCSVRSTSCLALGNYTFHILNGHAAVSQYTALSGLAYCATSECQVRGSKVATLQDYGYTTIIIRGFTQWYRIVFSDSDPHAKDQVHSGAVTQAKNEARNGFKISTGDSSRTVEAGSTDSGFEIVPSLSDKSSPRRRLNLPCILLEPHDANRIFFGRDDVLDLIRDALVPVSQDAGAGQDLRQFALCGLGGVGKTEIALEFALKYRDAFDAVFWVHADEPAKLDECFQEISIRLGLQTPEEATNQVVSRSLVKGWLANPTKDCLAVNDADITTTDSVSNRASWLIIFDNADDPKAIGDYWPLGSGSVLITSRDPLAKRLFSTCSSGLDLESLSDVDGGALLLKLTGSEKSPKEGAGSLAQHISHSVAGLPLAISQMAGIIRQRDLSLHEFLSIYEDAGKRAQLYGTKYDTSPRAYKYSVATVWALEKLSPDAKGLLKVLSFMDPDIIQESTLFDAAAAMFADMPFTMLRFRNACTELSQTSLIKSDKRKDDYRISIHRLVQDAVLSTMSNEDISSIFAVLVKTLWDKWPTAFIAPTKFSPILHHKDSNMRYQVGRFPICAGLYPHIIRLKQLWPSASSSTKDTTIRLAALLNDAAWYQSERGRTRDFDGFWTLAQELCESVPGDESNTILADIHFALGSNDAMTNQHDSSRQHKNAFLSIQKSICESIAPDFVDERLGLAYAELGISYTQDGLLDDAIEAYTLGREIRQKLGNTKLLSRDANLAIAYMERGDLLFAEDILMESLGLAESVTSAKDSHRYVTRLGPCLRIFAFHGIAAEQNCVDATYRTARFRSALGNLRILQGRLDEAYQEHTRALQLYIDTVGRTNQRTAEARHKVAEHFIRMQRYDEAIVQTRAGAHDIP
ncbi:hypothetical protein O1611_g417 [Lasiodiplodia mahajangana]|uniref:Uncharacterized protein n=1 Tax=Lasiodiplodia mahajangana TaxID=1108764 RepID=A0ACC2K0C9_9PEZI|nr:hypothetical protein O1611_g417 [Lasiodiplodia mahajangana]